MEDFLKQYEKQKIFKNIGIVIASLFLAIGVNISFSNQDINQYLKINLLETHKTTQKSDIYIERQNNLLHIKNGTPIQELKKIHFSIIFNNSNLNTKSIKNNIDNYTMDYIYLDYGVLNLELSNTQTEDIPAHTSIIEIEFNKLSEMQEYINILNAHFIDSSENTYLLSTSGIGL